ncbi:hypothetical protein, partial [Jeotgalibacillus marinus]
QSREEGETDRERHDDDPEDGQQDPGGQRPAESRHPCLRSCPATGRGAVVLVVDAPVGVATQHG